MENIKLFVTSVCPFCVGCEDYIQDNDLNVEIVDAAKSPEAQSELLEIGGMMQVPMLSIDGEALFESADILQWLKDHTEELK